MEGGGSSVQWASWAGGRARTDEQGLWVGAKMRAGAESWAPKARANRGRLHVVSGDEITRIGQGKGTGKRTGACRPTQPHLAVQQPALGKRRALIIRDTPAVVFLMH